MVLGQLTRYHLRVEAGVVDVLQVSSIDASVAVLVELEEGLVCECLSLGVQFALAIDEMGI